MADVGIRVLAGICGAALFTVINQYVLTLTGPLWLAALAAMFVVAFGLAMLIQRMMRKDTTPAASQTRGSDNVSGGAMTINIEGTPMPGATTSRDGAGNRSDAEMDITIKDKK